MTFPTDPLFTQSLLDHLQEGVLGLTKEGKLTFANARAGELLDIDVADVDGKVMHNLFQDLDDSGTPYGWTDSPIGYACRKEQPYKGEQEVFKIGEKEEEVLKVRYSCTPAPKVDDSDTDMFLVFSVRHGDAQTNATASLTDPVTGLGGMLLFQVMLKKAVSRAQRRQGRVGLVHVDVRGLQSINNSHGVDVGDAVLKDVAGRLEKVIRASDSVMRIDSDLFAIIAEDIETADAPVPLAERIEASLATPAQVKEQEVSIKTSLGLGVYPDHGWDDKDLFAKVGQALQNAKTQDKKWVMAIGNA